MGEGIESVFVHNTGEYLVDIGGWVIQSHAASHGFTFPQGTTVVPGSSVGVYENAVIGEKCPMDTARFFFACNEFGTPRTTRDFLFPSRQLELLNPSGEVVAVASP